MQEVLQVEQLYISALEGKQKRALLTDLSFTIARGEMLALVGESGSGKSLTASAIMGLLPPKLVSNGGSIRLLGEEIHCASEKRKRQLRGKQIGYIFQDYQGSFTPFFKIGAQMVETLCTHHHDQRAQAKAIVQAWLTEVGLPAERVYDSYPFQLSGGQLQRAAIAQAMMLEPTLLIADEPTTALDVLTGEKVLDLLQSLQKRTECAVLLISHDLTQVMKRADQIAVIKEGRIVESDQTARIRTHAKHPYTQLLINARRELFAEGREVEHHG